MTLAEQITGIARAIAGLLIVRPPRSENAGKDITAAAIFGPFKPGDLVRVQATENAWCVFGSKAEAEAAAVGVGAMVPAWGEGQDFAIWNVGEGPREAVWCGIVSVGGAGTGLAWKAGRLDSSPVFAHGDADNSRG